VIMAQRAEDVPRLEQGLRELMQRGGAGDLIAEVRSARQLLPETRSESIEEGKALKAAITPKLRAQLRPAEREQLDRSLSDESLVPLEANDLPEAFAAGLRERSGEVGRSVLVFPKVGGGTWQAERLASFAHDVRALAAGASAVAAGPLLLSSDLAHAMRADGPRVAALSFVCVIAICIAAFGVAGRKAWLFSGLSVAALLLGVTFMLGLLAWTGAKLNFQLRRAADHVRHLGRLFDQHAASLSSGGRRRRHARLTNRRRARAVLGDDGHRLGGAALGREPGALLVRRLRDHRRAHVAARRDLGAAGVPGVACCAL
jgi:hypothetical protein